MKRILTLFMLALLVALCPASASPALSAISMGAVRESGFTNAKRKALIGDWNLAPPRGRKWRGGSPITLSLHENPYRNGIDTLGYEVRGTSRSGETFQETAARMLGLARRGATLGQEVSATSGSEFTFVDDSHIRFGSQTFGLRVVGGQLVTSDSAGTVSWNRKR